MIWVSARSSAFTSLAVAGVTYSEVYCRYFLKRFLCVKKGDSVQTSSSLTLREFDTSNSGSTKENVDQVHKFALSSGIVYSLDDG